MKPKLDGLLDGTLLGAPQALGITTDHASFFREVDKAHGNGDLVITGITKIGPIRQCPLFTFATREHLDSDIRGLRSLSPAECGARLKDIRRILRTLAHRIDRMTPDEDATWNNAMITQLAARMLWDRTVIAGSGLILIDFFASADETRPWHRRGLPDPALIQEIGSNCQPRSLAPDGPPDRVGSTLSMSRGPSGQGAGTASAARRSRI